MVRFGPSLPKGFLPVFSVGSEEEAKHLLTMACHTNYQGEFIAKELAAEQSLDNLYAFGERLKDVHDKYIAGGQFCDCK